MANSNKKGDLVIFPFSSVCKSTTTTLRLLPLFFKENLNLRLDHIRSQDPEAGSRHEQSKVHVIASAIQNKECLLVNVIAMILDPLFFYILVLNDEKKCIHWDKTLGITATVIRSVLDFLKLVYIIFELHKADKKENQKEKFKKLCQQLKDFKIK
ncbi:hypothetical protein CUMW_090150 [Citrus unshiu]|nr:hypothetical protein CUMW_090150 [Citrus unshiu]